MKRRVTTLSLRVATDLTVGASEVAHVINRALGSYFSDDETKRYRTWNVDEAKAITTEIVDREDFNEITVVLAQE